MLPSVCNICINAMLICHKAIMALDHWTRILRCLHLLVSFFLSNKGFTLAFNMLISCNDHNKTETIIPMHDSKPKKNGFHTFEHT